jgi:hypothetical protein
LRPDNLAIACAIINLGHTLRLTVIAEVSKPGLSWTASPAPL